MYNDENDIELLNDLGDRDYDGRPFKNIHDLPDYNGYVDSDYLADTEHDIIGHEDLISTYISKNNDLVKHTAPKYDDTFLSFIQILQSPTNPNEEIIVPGTNILAKKYFYDNYAKIEHYLFETVKDNPTYDIARQKVLAYNYKNSERRETLLARKKQRDDLLALNRELDEKLNNENIKGKSM